MARRVRIGSSAGSSGGMAPFYQLHACRQAFSLERAAPSALNAEDLPQFGRQGAVQLGVGARLRRSVRSETLQRRGVPEPVALEVVVAHLGHQFGAQRLPRQVLSGAPPTRPSGESLTWAPFGTPRMVVSGPLAVRRE